MISEYLLENLKEEGKRLGVPKTKTRALIREYLQTKIIFYLYDEKGSEKLSFIGGTALRLLHNLDRFSEDLDFDNLGFPFLKIKKIFERVKGKLEKEGFEIDYKMRKTNKSGIGELKFKNLLFSLSISSHIDEKLIIRINYTTPRTKLPTENLILNRFGIVQNVVTNTLGSLFSQKLRAILNRKDLLPRDFYDVVWFISHRIKPDPKLFPEMKVKNEKELVLKLENIYLKKVKPNLKEFKKRLAPFLIDEKKVFYLDIFDKVLKSLIKD